MLTVDACLENSEYVMKSIILERTKTPGHVYIEFCWHAFSLIACKALCYDILYNLEMLSENCFQNVLRL